MRQRIIKKKKNVCQENGNMRLEAFTFKTITKTCLSQDA